ncbi:SDR family oxidoreductase [Agrilactobacillus yilanensis]|uniref:SDR family oxidoreductase n=1 Tax=Agrilactobacillus yilanensis TaxID=2485997 RepID=A0ABW4J8C4_9LACO|nr:SDR family oxidoreductase [Agrilactobacillus yilanensis]
MNVFVIGAHGKIGTLLLPKLNQTGYQVYAGIRDEAQAAEVKAAGATPVLIDLLGTTQGLATSLEKMDAVVFAAGSGGATGYDMTLLIDLDGAVKAAEAAKMAGVKRFVIVSSGASNTRATWGQQIRPYMAAKYYADQEIKKLGLDYTIIRPGILTNETATNRFLSEPGIGLGQTITREDVATFITAVLGTPSTIRQAYDLVNGSQSLAAILN